MTYSLKIHNFSYCGSIQIGDQFEITFKYFTISKRSGVNWNIWFCVIISQKCGA